MRDDESQDIPMLERWSMDGQDTGYMGGTTADQCNSCTRRAADLSLRCEAFPELGSIPVEIADGSFDHNRRHPEDGGIRRLQGKPAWDPATSHLTAPWEMDETPD